jgi:hypothetical protein
MLTKFCPRSWMSPFEVVHAIQSAGVGVVGLDLRRTVVVLRFVDVGETAVIRHPVTSATVARVRIDDERAGPPPSPIQTYKQSWISTTATATTTTSEVHGKHYGTDRLRKDVFR